MKKITLLFLSLIALAGCQTAHINSTKVSQLKFLNEYVVPDSLIVDGTVVGGLSGIDYEAGTSYLICDDAFNPRYYQATITVNKDKLTDIHFDEVHHIIDTANFLDMEGIRYDTEKKVVVITSEGSIKRGISPSLFTIDANNNIDKLKIPQMFSANSEQQPRNNGTLEGLSLSTDKKGYWIAMELPLKADGPEPAYEKADSPVRITYIDAKSGMPGKQFAYYLDPIVKKPEGDFAVNGVPDILEYAKDRFFIIERAYSSGWGTQGNTVRIYEADARKTTNTLEMSSLKDKGFRPAVKTLLFDFESVRDQLTKHIVDNIEGITFGPTLSNGHKSLILVSDNNFNQLGEQITQFILLEIID